MNEFTSKILDAVLQGLGELSKSDEQQVRMTVFLAMEGALRLEVNDMIAFIQWSGEHGKCKGWVAANLMHDLNGIYKCEPCFSPRTSGYSDLV
jgi:hypothetical protein